MAIRATPIGVLKGAVSESQARSKADATERASAANILNPNDIQGDYDVQRMLVTTLGGIQRSITNNDLAAFRQNARTAGSRFKGGITARQIIDLSLNGDRDRARRQITVAVPSSAKAIKGSGGSGVNSLEVRFITNASRDSKETRHHVVVQFMGYPSAVASGAVTPMRAAAMIRKQAVRFDCDCGRHRYWFRYISTIGNYHAGRAENGYPKIRNPDLSGVACKHVLRVMAEIEGSGVVQSFLTRAIENGRSSETGSASVRTSQKDADKLAEKQAARPKAKGNTGDRNYDRSRAALRKSSKTVPTHKKKAGSGRRLSALASKPEAHDALMGIITKLGITKEQAIAIINGAGK